MRSKFEVKCQKELESEGYLCDFKIRPSRYYPGMAVDYFHLFDIIAVKDNELRWISIKGQAGVPKEHRHDLESFNILGFKEVWTYRYLAGNKRKFAVKKERWSGDEWLTL